MVSPMPPADPQGCTGLQTRQFMSACFSPRHPNVPVLSVKSWIHCIEQAEVSNAHRGHYPENSIDEVRRQDVVKWRFLPDPSPFTAKEEH
jgi:hypothetical protein